MVEVPDGVDITPVTLRQAVYVSSCSIESKRE